MTKSVSPVAAWEALFRAQVAVMRQIAAEFPSEVISLNEYDVLFNLSIAPERTLRIRELNENVLLTQPSISRLIDRLAARGLVDKVTDPSDGRGTLVSLTDEGWALFREAARVHARSISGRMSDSLSTDELTELARLCTKLRDGVTSK
jgi:DNA-binding MarR family transcriptional regulator